MNGFLLLIPFMLIRFGFLSILNKEGLKRAAFFAPLVGKVKVAYWFYRISRNPMYVACFIYFLGCVLLTQSLILLAILIVFQISAHWIIRSEERWCIKKFGEEYKSYMSEVRRYI